jgi:hypothetical protein
MRRQPLHPADAHYGLPHARVACGSAALLAECPFLEPEDLQQALRYAAAAVDDELLAPDRVA